MSKTGALAFSVEPTHVTLPVVAWWKSTLVVIMVWCVFALVWTFTSYVDGFSENAINQHGWNFQLNFTVLVPYILLNSVLAVCFNRHAEKLSRFYALACIYVGLILLFVPMSEIYQLAFFIYKDEHRWLNLVDIEKNFSPAYFSQSALHTSLAFFGQVLYSHWVLHQQRELAFEKAIQGNLSLKIRILQAKLEPYFLLSSLENIQKLIQGAARAEANTALVRLSNLLRHVLDHDAGEAIPVAAEMQFLRDYFNLQKLCLGQGFSINWEQQDLDWYSYSCPGLILLSLADASISQILKGYASDNQVLELRFKCFVTDAQFYASFSFPQVNPQPLELNPSYTMASQRLEILFGGEAKLSSYISSQELRQTISVDFPLQLIPDD